MIRFVSTLFSQAEIQVQIQLPLHAFHGITAHFPVLVFSETRENIVQRPAMYLKKLRALN